MVLLEIPVRNVNTFLVTKLFLKASGESRSSRGHSCYIVAQNMSITFLCPETLSEAEFRHTELMGSRPPMWLLVAGFSQVNSKNYK